MTIFAVLGFVITVTCCSLIFPPFLTEAVLKKHGNSQWTREKFNEATRALVAFDKKIQISMFTGSSIESVRGIPYHNVLNIVKEIDREAVPLFNQYLSSLGISKYRGYDGFDAEKVSKLGTIDAFLHSIYQHFSSPQCGLVEVFNFIEHDLRGQFGNLMLEYWLYKSSFEVLDNLPCRLGEVESLLNPTANAYTKRCWDTMYCRNKKSRLTTHSYNYPRPLDSSGPLVNNRWPMRLVKEIHEKPEDVEQLLSRVSKEVFCNSYQNEDFGEQRIEYISASKPSIQLYLVDRKTAPLPVAPVPLTISHHDPQIAQKTSIIVSQLALLLDYATTIVINTLFSNVLQSAIDSGLIRNLKRFNTPDMNDSNFFDAFQHYAYHERKSMYERLFLSSIGSRFHYLISSKKQMLQLNLVFGFPMHDSYSGTVSFCLSV